MKYLEVVGWDNGYDFEKIVTKGGKVKFPSIVHKPIQKENLMYNKTNDYSKDNMEVVYEGITYYVGMKAFNNSSDGGEVNHNPKKFKYNSEMAKFLAGITCLHNEKKIDIEMLVIGLSIFNKQKDRREAEKFYKDRTFEFEIGGQKREVKVNKVTCIPQGIGAYYDIAFNSKGEINDASYFNGRFGIVDVGGKTTDTFIGNGKEIINESQASIDVGVSRAYKQVSRGIKSILIEQAYLNDQDSVRYGTEEIIGLKGKCESSFKSLSETIFTNVMNEWEGQQNRVDKIIILGGGAKNIGQYLKEQFIYALEREVILFKNPQFANANGYYKLGLYILRELDTNGEE